jgi:hypothetical protein
MLEISQNPGGKWVSRRTPFIHPLYFLNYVYISWSKIAKFSSWKWSTEHPQKMHSCMYTFASILLLNVETVLSGGPYRKDFEREPPRANESLNCTRVRTKNFRLPDARHRDSQTLHHSSAIRVLCFAAPSRAGGTVRIFLRTLVSRSRLHNCCYRSGVETIPVAQLTKEFSSTDINYY